MIGPILLVQWGMRLNTDVSSRQHLTDTTIVRDENFEI